MSWIHEVVTGPIGVSDLIRQAATNGSLSAAAINAGGTGYAVGDLVSINGGTTVGGFAAVLEITAIGGGGAATAVAFDSAGVYTVNPGVAATTTTVSGAGSGLTVDTILLASNGWTERLDESWDGRDGGPTDHRKVVLEGVGGGSDQIFVGWRTFEQTGQANFGVEWHGMSAYDALLEFEDQPNISLGFMDLTIAADRAGCYTPIAETQNEVFMSVTSSRIVGTIRVGSNYWNFYIGFFNRYATATEYPYPLAICGSTSSPDISATTSAFASGVNDPTADTTYLARGPTQVFYTDNSWQTVRNSTNSSSRPQLDDRCVYPVQIPQGPSDTTNVPEQDRAWAAGLDLGLSVWTRSGVPGNPTAILRPTPGQTESKYALLPTIIAFGSIFPVGQIIGELDSVRHVHGTGGVVSEDVILDGSTRYRVFQNCTRTDDFAKMAIEEA